MHNVVLGDENGAVLYKPIVRPGDLRGFIDIHVG